jgi:enoyl-CoA hydratase/carnithine racemase
MSQYSFAALERRGSILLVRLHTEEGSLVWSEVVHRELSRLFIDIGSDPEISVVILTGTGERFIAERLNHESFGSMTDPMVHDKIFREAKHLLLTFLDIDALVITALNGPTMVHSELPLLGDIVLASRNASFQDGVHFQTNSVPGDGLHSLFPLWLGPNRARYFLLMGQVISAEEALQLGLVAEITEAQDLLPRAWEIAERFARRSRLPIRYTRMAITMQLKRALQFDLQEGLLLEQLARGISPEEAFPPWAPGEDFSRRSS